MFSCLQALENIKWRIVHSVTSLSICLIAFQSELMVQKLNIRAIFVWPWNKNARTIQKQQTNRNRAIWLVYRTHTNAGGFWLVKRTLGWKNFMPENFLEINRYFVLTSHCHTIGQRRRQRSEREVPRHWTALPFIENNNLFKTLERCLKVI